MPTYRVTWEIDVEATSARAAAIAARKIQLRADSLATVFEIRRNHAHGATPGRRRASLSDAALGVPVEIDIDGVCLECHHHGDETHRAGCSRAPRDPSSIDIRRRTVRR